MKRVFLVYENVLLCLTKYRGLKVESVYTKKDFINEMQYEHVIKINATNPRNGETVIVLLTKEESKYMDKLANFRKMLTNKVSQLRDTEKMTEKINVIIISSNALGNNLEGEVIKYNSLNGIYIEHYDYSYFKMELPTHFMYAEHTLMNEEEIKKVESQLSVSRINWPVIFHNKDGGAIWIGARPGNCIKLREIAETSGEKIEYRIVI